MAKRTTKAEIILSGARERVRQAQDEVAHAVGQLGIANATLHAHTSVLEQLEKDLAQAPRKRADPKSPTPSAGKKSSRKGAEQSHTASTEGGKGDALDASSRCAICGNGESHPDHQTDSDVYHRFRTALKKRNSKDNGGVVLPDDPTQFQHEATV